MLKNIHLTEQEFLVEMSLWLFAAKKISFGMARKMASMDVFQFQDLLDERGITIHYDVDEYLTDLKNLQILKWHGRRQWYFPD